MNVPLVSAKAWLMGLRQLVMGFDIPEKGSRGFDAIMDLGTMISDGNIQPEERPEFWRGAGALMAEAKGLRGEKESVEALQAQKLVLGLQRAGSSLLMGLEERHLIAGLWEGFAGGLRCPKAQTKEERAEALRALEAWARLAKENSARAKGLAEWIQERSVALAAKIEETSLRDVVGAREEKNQAPRI